MGEPAETRRFDPLPREMKRGDFIEKFGGVYEHFPEIARNAWMHGLTEAEDTPAGLAAAMARVAAAMNKASKLNLIRNHPDLAGRAAIAGEMTAASTAEQAAAGLANCTPEEYARFQTLNAAYKKRFGFPFILAIAGKTRGEILAAFEARLENGAEAEFRTALAEIDKIARLRLESLAAR
jgi:OHCU decarboxylase